MSRVLTASYRLQLTRDFPLASVRAIVPYLNELGVSHLYLSPLLAAKPGSAHGYDLIDHSRLNPELGTKEELRELADQLHERGMGIILDIVPNHMAAVYENPQWRDVLERGAASKFAHWFDIDWEAPRAKKRVVLPVLGDELDEIIARDEFRIDVTDRITSVVYHDRRFPLDPTSLPPQLQLAQLDPTAGDIAGEWIRGDSGRHRLRELLDAQHYLLTFWRRGPAELNYRRFFDVNDLVAIRMETDDVFDATHSLLLRWIADGIIDGVRVDHVDGLSSPAWYLAKLRREVDVHRHPDAPERIPIFVEKILAADEALPSDWPVDGTTGYEFMNQVEELFLDPEGYAAIDASYRTLRRNPSLAFSNVARKAKRDVLNGALRPDVARVARLAHEWRPSVSADAFAGALIALISSLPVYRTYVSVPGVVTDVDRRVLSSALDEARTDERVDTSALQALQDAFFAPDTPGDVMRTELVVRFQQISGPAAAKGVEDTALYAYVPLLSRNEVGGSPEAVLGGAPMRLHDRNTSRAIDAPGALLAVNTHDTKRSADVRARLDTLTSLPREWSRYVSRWRRLNRKYKGQVNGRPTPDTNTEYLYYQALLGIWPSPRPRRRADDLPDAMWRDAARERLVAYMLKAAREAKMWTSWTDADQQYERVLDAFVCASLASDEHFLPDVARLTAKIAVNACAMSLARTMIQCSAPGVPDVYQGDELWNFTLVDPDNRRSVDYNLRGAMLPSAAPDLLAATLSDEANFLNDRTKFAVLSAVLRFRRAHAQLFARGDYMALDNDTIQQAGLFVFARRQGEETCISLARTRLARPGSEGWGDCQVRMPPEFAGEWQSILTARTIRMESRDGASVLRLGDALPECQPCDLLFRSSGTNVL